VFSFFPKVIFIKEASAPDVKTSAFGVNASPVVISENDFFGRLKEEDKFIEGILEQGKVIRGGGFIGRLQRAP